MATRKEMAALIRLLEKATDNDGEMAERILDWATTQYPIWILKIFKGDKDLRNILRQDRKIKMIVSQDEE